ncbi:MAG: PfkB family carbohydrate kinase [Fibrobacterota bacterium]
MSLLIVGSIGIDTIHTEHGSAVDCLGGSASYAAVAAGFFDNVRLVGIVGDDFPQENIRLFRKKNVDLEGLQVVKKGKTFRWTGKYHENFSTRDTLEIHLNVFEAFRPQLPQSYKNTPFVLLANIDPELQLQVLDQMRRPKFTAADTMDLWLNIKRDKVEELIRRVDLIVMNDEEAQQYSGEKNLVRAGKRILKSGVSYAIVKKGSHGALLFSKKEIFQLPAWPLERVIDPTGAGDTFIGAFMGVLSSAGKVTPQTLRRAMASGTAAASYNVEAFSLDNLKKISRNDLLKRIRGLSAMTRF